MSEEYQNAATESDCKDHSKTKFIKATLPQLPGSNVLEKPRVNSACWIYYFLLEQETLIVKAFN